MQFNKNSKNLFTARSQFLGFPVGSVVKNRLPMQETQETPIQSPDREDTLKKKMATHFSTEDPGGIEAVESKSVGHDLATKQWK